MKYLTLLIAVVVIAGCTTNTNNPIQVVQNNTPETVGAEINQVYENEFLDSRTPFLGATANKLYDMEVKLTGAGRINIYENSTIAEYFRIDFNVTNYANRDMGFPYEAKIVETDATTYISDEKRPLIPTLKPNETASGYVLFKNYQRPTEVVELTISGGYRQYSSDRINFRFKIDFRNESQVFLQRVPLDFPEEGNAIHPGGFLLVKIPTDGTYRYWRSSSRNVSVDVWQPGTKINTIQFGNSTINSTCSVKLQTTASRECILETNQLLTVKRTINLRTQDLDGATVSFYLSRVIQVNDTAGALKYTGQATYDFNNKEFFVVL